MAFLDAAAANASYPHSRRETARYRRSALEHHLGKPVLHGLISHGGSDCNAFVDKSSLAVLHVETYPSIPSRRRPE
jgi:hypothetical protein